MAAATVDPDAVVIAVPIVAVQLRASRRWRTPHAGRNRLPKQQRRATARRRLPMDEARPPRTVQGSTAAALRSLCRGGITI